MDQYNLFIMISKKRKVVFQNKEEISNIDSTFKNSMRLSAWFIFSSIFE